MNRFSFIDVRSQRASERVDRPAERPACLSLGPAFESTSVGPILEFSYRLLSRAMGSTFIWTSRSGVSWVVFIRSPFVARLLTARISGCARLRPLSASCST